nr:hypothetical protein [Tanacetum cinerariifolium]
MAKDIWQSLLITHQDNCQVKDNKIDLLVQQYEQFTILEEVSIDSGFTRFNTIITSLIALDEAKKESSDDETSTSRSDDEEYAMAVRNLKKFLEERVNLFGNQEKQRSHSDKEMRRKERVTGNILDAVIQIISLAIVQNHLATKIKRPSLEVLGAIAKITPKIKLAMKLASWLNRRMRKKLIHNSIDESKKASLRPSPKSDIDEWIKDSGCSKYMIDNKSLFSTYKAYDRGYSQNSKAYVVLNKHTMKVEESLNVTFNESPPSTKLCDDFAKIMHDVFEMSMMSELNFSLGLQIKQMEDEIFFNQSKYVKEMLKKFGLEDSKPTKTPMSTESKLTKDDEADFVDSSKYLGMIGSLLYLTASRPDIMFSICLCARFQENPKTTHLEAVKRIFRYLRGTSHLGLWYLKGTRTETVVSSNSDHAGDYVNRKSTSGVCTFIGCCLTSWFAKKQTALAISTTEAEYVSVGKACQQALWMKQALINYGIRLDDVPIMCDNKGAIDLSKNPVQHSRTKHI